MPRPPAPIHLTARLTAPALSILIGHPRDEPLLARVLDGFDRQTFPAARVERIVFGADPRTTIAAARNAALRKARAPLVLWFDGRHWPMPSLVEYCLDVHRTHTRVDETLLLGVIDDGTRRRQALPHWLRMTKREPDQPAASGVYAWPYFRTRALACKRALFEVAGFDERFQAGEDVQLAARLVRSVPLKVVYETRPQAVLIAPTALDAALEAEYLDGYFRQVRIGEDPRARLISDVEDRFAFAERFVRTEAELATLSASLGQLEATLADAEPELASGEDYERLQLVYQMYDAIFAHAAACGWLDAERRTPARPASLWHPGVRSRPRVRARARPARRRALKSVRKGNRRGTR